MSASISVIKLGDAFFCLSCELVTNCSDFCPACGNSQLWPLENWIGRVDAHEFTWYESFLDQMLPAERAEFPKTPRKNYWEALRNRSRRSLESIIKPDRTPDKIE